MGLTDRLMADEISGNQQRDDQHDEELDNDEVEVSLDDLGAAYARAAAKHDPEAFATAPSDGEQTLEENDKDDSSEVVVDDVAAEDVVTPEMIIEGALFVGHPQNKSLTEQRLASLMRGVSPEEVVQLIGQLNQSYRDAAQALRIVQDEQGYRMTIAAEVENIRRSFLGKVREARLSQAAIEVLALVAYQPGVTAQKIVDQRGRESGALLNQLVRRQMLSIERVKPEGGGRGVPHYYPTERFLVLFGLESLDDLPHVEEGLREV
jgi:segregation and condensation protein B